MLYAIISEKPIQKNNDWQALKFYIRQPFIFKQKKIIVMASHSFLPTRAITIKMEQKQNPKKYPHGLKKNTRKSIKTVLYF